MLIDSHAHLEMPDFDRDRNEVIMRAGQAGVERIITVGTTLSDCRKAISIAAQHEAVYAAIGIHPHEVKGIHEKTYDDLKQLAKSGKVVAFGEIGLDFFYNLSAKDVQIRRFGEQLELAEDIGLPIIIHDREAHQETMDMLQSWKGTGGVVHCFSGDYAMARQCLDLGFYLSVPGVITFGKSQQLQDVVRRIPETSLLMETDAPYLAPNPNRGKRNEPAYVMHTAKKVAEIKGVSFEHIAEVSSRNAQTLFGIT
jgi:TatD DNase family protein